MFYVISYDVTDNKRRLKVSNILDDYGDRVQYSVFECILGGKKYDEMVRRLKEVIDEENDKLRIYPLCGTCKEKVLIMGKGELFSVEDVYVY